MTDTTDILEQLTARLDGMNLEIAWLRSTLDIQFKRIAALQAEVDLLPASRRRRRHAMRPPTVASPPVRGRNGNGHG
jgi:hypothetical protein